MFVLSSFSKRSHRSVHVKALLKDIVPVVNFAL